MHAPIAFHVNLFRPARSEHGIKVRGNGNVRPCSGGSGKSDDIAGAIDLRLASQFAEAHEHPFRAFGLEKCWGGDTAQLQMLLGDPLPILMKLLQHFLDARLFGQPFYAGNRGERLF